MFYYYYNPRTKKGKLVKDFSEKVEISLLEDKENDILIAISGYSNAIKVFKYHFESFAGDYEGSECIAEMPLDKELASSIINKYLKL